ncbi:lactonase family protein [Natrinema salsiterrestre]|uniref:Lactonase family protein n=1 Tax=Natrinema salsiterrestre TaxID=2950540 RepID=A0A9Q4Q218_9EURY|nr:lactonase family protein [Natrinema salsiterrestre]MDF9747854.1 lactonase family protein [Natrinema salsiterrestre]
MTRENYIAAVGTYSAATDESIFTVAVDPDTGSMKQLDAVAAGPDPTFVAFHPSRDYLYAAVREEKEGLIRSYEVDRDTGELTERNSASSGAAGPCYCSVDGTGQFLLVAHYTGGAISMLPLDSDGEIGSPCEVIEHHGSSIDSDRQTAPHPHSITLGPENRFAYVPDLGTDQIHVYAVDHDRGSLSRAGVVNCPPGSGPRHLSFSTDSDQVYVINELDSTVTVFDRQSDGLLTERSTVSTLPSDFGGDNKTAEIATHPIGDYVYGSNRGQDTIVTFAVDDETITRVDQTPTCGEWPRHFAIAPDGEFLFVENRYTNDIIAFDVDTATGKLSPANESLSITEPVCMQWMPDRHRN